MSTYNETMLERAEARLEEWVRSKSDAIGFDHGMLNIPMRKRGVNIDREIDKYKRLQGAVEYWQGKVRAEKARAEAPRIREAKKAAHDAADLKARFGHCKQVQWALNGRWYDVERWSRKSVRVGTGHDSMLLGYSEVMDAR